MPSHAWLIPFLAAGLACGCQQSRAGAGLVTIAATPTVDTVRPEKKTVERSLLLSGDLSAYQEARLYAKVSGYLKSVPVDIGDPVRPGQLLAVIEAPELDAEHSKQQAEVTAAQAEIRGSQAEAGQAEAGVSEAQAVTGVASAHIREVGTELAIARAGASLARQKLRRLEAVYQVDPGSVAALDLEVARADVAEKGSTVEAALARRLVAQRQLQAAQSRTASARANLQARLARVESAKDASEVKSRQMDSSQVVARYQELRSPLQGFVVARNLDPGALVQAAAQSAQNQIVPILIVADSRRLRLILQVPESEAASVSVGTPAQVEIVGREPLQAKVSRTSRSLDAQTRTMRAEIDIANASLALKPGMMARVRLRLSRHEGVWALPPAAILSDKGKRSVWVVEGGLARKLPIKIGFEDEQSVEVTEGIAGGEQVVSEGKEQILGKGGPVRFR